MTVVASRRVGQGRFDRRPTSGLANRIGGPSPKRLVPPYGAKCVVRPTPLNPWNSSFPIFAHLLCNAAFARSGWIQWGRFGICPEFTSRLETCSTFRGKGIPCKAAIRFGR